MRWLKLGAAAMLLALIGGCGHQPRSRVYGHDCQRRFGSFRFSSWTVGLCHFLGGG